MLVGSPYFTHVPGLSIGPPSVHHQLPWRKATAPSREVRAHAVHPDPEPRDVHLLPGNGGGGAAGRHRKGALQVDRGAFPWWGQVGVGMEVEGRGWRWSRGLEVVGSDGGGGIEAVGVEPGMEVEPGMGMEVLGSSWSGDGGGEGERRRGWRCGGVEPAMGDGDGGGGGVEPGMGDGGVEVVRQSGAGGEWSRGWGWRW